MTSPSPGHQSAPAAILHYHEISLKRGNRPLFLRHLQENLLRAIDDLGPVRLVQLTGRIMLDLSRHPDPARLRERLARVCGVANFSLALRTGVSREALRAAVGQAIEGRPFRTFRISARRAFKTFPMTSVELNRDLGAHVLALRPDVRVSLEHAELDVRVEVLPGEAFVYADRDQGAGGLPVGASGTVAALLSGGIDSPVAAYRMMRRGCSVLLIHFHSYPILSRASQEKVREIAALLTTHQLRSRLMLVPFGALQQQVVLAVPPELRVVIYRRLMLRIAERLARRARAHALVTGEVLGQVASQTLENMTAIAQATSLEILRPLVGMDKDEITAEARRIGTYPISIIPDQDCCTLFTPKHPATRARVGHVELAERALPVDEMVAAAVEGAVVEDFRFPMPVH
jgi:thiamine biosynthesis protein ThiI